MKKITTLLYFLLFTGSLAFGAQSIAEKMAGINHNSAGLDPTLKEELNKTNAELAQYQTELARLYTEAQQLYENGASDQAFQILMNDIRTKRKQIQQTEEQWRQQALSTNQEEPYALWHQPSTAIEQLVLDYGSQDYVYLIPPEIASLRISVTSSLAIPRESWDEMLTLILTQNGIGFRQLNPFLRQLYFMSQNRSSIAYVTHRRQDLQMMPLQARGCFVLIPTAHDAQKISLFLEKFSNNAITSLQVIGGQLFIISTTEGIQDLLKLYDFIEANRTEKGYHLISLRRIDAKEMANILTLYFDGSVKPSGEGESSRTDSSGLRVLALEHLPGTLFVAGPLEEVQQAKKIVEELEGQLQDPREKTIYWYTVQHSEAKELAKVLNAVYDLMLTTPLVGQPLGAHPPIKDEKKHKEGEKIEVQLPSYSQLFLPDPYKLDPSALVVNPKQVATNRDMLVNGQPEIIGNFIVDPKTGSIIMVVEQELLPSLKALLKKLDVPKKMVRIEVLLFEKKITDANHFGLDLLQVADAAPNVNSTAVSFNNVSELHVRGIFEFAFSQAKSAALPAYNFIYNFLLRQDDIRINANPSVTTVNHTKASISLVEEISLDNGTYVIPDIPNSAFKQSFSRAQFGITLNITPTVNVGLAGENGDPSTYFITLETDVVFDTPKKSPKHDRPNVDRRRITNEVRIENGQTVILGGLRSKMSEDMKTSLPFLGEIPGVGKLFSSTTMEDRTTEMFVFITPTVIEDPIEDLKLYTLDAMKRRPGDIPEFLHALHEARANEKHHLFEQTLRALFDRPPGMQ